MVTRILHVSDTHLGNRQYGGDVRLGDFLDAFEEAIEYAIDEDVDAVIHTGDLFDSRDPRLPDLNRCIDLLQRLDDANIPFLGIVGNHERKMDDQYLDLISKTGAAERLDDRPRMVNSEVAVYGIDAVAKPAWHAKDFTLDEPPDDAYSILCMHQLLHPPVPEIFAEHSLDDVLDRVNIDLDALALGDYHETEGVIRDGTRAWYAGSTERCTKDEKSPRTVSLLEIKDNNLTRREKELDTRDFLTITIAFSEDDGRDHAENEIARHNVDGKVVLVTVTGESTSVTSRDIREIVMSRGAAVCQVDDQRGGFEFDDEERSLGDIESADRLIQERLAEQNLSEISVEIEERVRMENVARSGFDDEVERMMMKAQNEAFDSSGAVPTEGEK